MAEKDRKDGIEVIEKAIMFATQAHEGQVRKGTDRPFIVHPLEVGRIVASMTEDEEIISAAILHDTIEDCEEITEEVICREFTKRVAEWRRKVKISLRHGWSAKGRRLNI